MARTNIDIDDELIGRAMRLYGVSTKREAVDLALRHLVGDVESGDLGELRGTGWLGELDELRSPRGAA